MSTLLALALQVAAPAAAAPAVPSVMEPPAVATWLVLPELRFRRRLPNPDEMAAFVRTEVAGGRCAIAGDALTLPVDLILFVARSGMVRRVVPRAIGCATVEQYAAGLALRMARDNLVVADGAGDGWYRTRIVFSLK